MICHWAAVKNTESEWIFHLKCPLWSCANPSLPKRNCLFAQKGVLRSDLAGCERASMVQQLFRIVDLCVNTSTHLHTFTHPAARGCRSGLISVALTLIGACVPWLCVSLEYHAEPQSPALPFTLPAGLHCQTTLSLSSSHMITMTTSMLVFLLV